MKAVNMRPRMWLFSFLLCMKVCLQARMFAEAFTEGMLVRKIQTHGVNTEPVSLLHRRAGAGGGLLRGANCTAFSDQLGERGSRSRS